MQNTHKLVSDFLELQHNYQFTRRALMTKERFRDVAKSDNVKGLDMSLDELKEPLIEHIGHLPILASYLHEYIEHSAEVNLGRSLIMLSIHDIGETKLGDVFAYTKTNIEEVDDVEVARDMLSSSLLTYFDEYEANETLDAKFAKSVDILAPLIHEIDMIGYIHTRFMTLGGNNSKIINKKRKYLEWDKELLAVFDILLEQSQRFEDKQPLLFPVVDYDLK